MSAEMKGKLDQVSDQIKGLNEDAQTKWAAWEKARDEFAASGADKNDVESEDFKSVEQVHKAYAEVKDQIANVEKARDSIINMLGADAPKRAPGQAVAEKQEQFSGKSLPEVLAERVTSSEQYKEAQSRLTQSAQFGQLPLGKGLTRAESKALITGVSNTSGGAFIVDQRVGYISQPMRMSIVRSLLTVGTTDSDAVEYARQTAFTNVAVETAEATSTTTGTKPEATIAFEKVTEAVRNIANWVPATRRSLADEGQMRTIIESWLRYALELRLETQIVSGGGTGEDFRGILNTPGILTQAKGADSRPDAIHKAITQIRLGYLEPNGIGLHPTDWEEIRLTRDDSGAAAGTGGYLWGPPSEVGGETIWGLPVVSGTQFPLNTGLVGDYRQAALWLREGVQVYASDSHSDFFVKNLVAVLAEMRAAFGVLRPAAFCAVTGI